MDNTVSSIDVFILCGGLGSRLSEISKDRPKSMMVITGRPFMDILLDHLYILGFRRFILGVGHKAKVLIDYYKKNPLKGATIAFSVEKRPLGTAGALKNARGLLRSDVFFVLNGDSFCKFSPERLLRFHREKKLPATMLLKKISDGRDYGRVKIDRLSRVIGYNEKCFSSRNCLINAGVYVFDKTIFNLMAGGKQFSLEHDFFPVLAAKGNICGLVQPGYFIDIGTPERFQKAERAFKRKQNDR